MHRIEIPSEIRERSLRTRGREHFLSMVDIARTAHVVVDLQEGFMKEGALVEVPVAREIVPNVNAITAAMRAAGGLNLYLRFTYNESEPLAWTAWYGACLDPDYSTRLKRAFAPGGTSGPLSTCGRATSSWTRRGSAPSLRGPACCTTFSRRAPSTR